MKVTTDDGWPLGVTVDRPDGVARATVIALPAMMADARSLDRPAGSGLASTLAAAGLEVWRADFRGHGASPPTPRQGGRWSYDELVRQDVPALVRAARALRRPVVVLGHSLGGHVSAAAAAEGVPIDALVLLAANVWMPSLEPSSGRRVRKAAVMRAFEAASRPLGRFPSRRLRFGPADESAAYVRDLCRFWWEDRFGSRDGTDWLVGMRSFRGRVLAVAGAGDHLLAHPEAARRFCDGFPSGAVDFWVAGGTSDMPFRPGHAALACDGRSRPVWERIARWTIAAVG